MKLLLIHGPPASGKLTVAKEVIRLTGGRLFDNHAALDFAKTVLDFDAPGFWELVQSIRLAALDAAARFGSGLLVQTACYSHPEDLSLVEDFERVLAKHGATLLPVYLTCSAQTLEARVGGPDRAARGKVASVEGLRRCLSRWNLVPIPRPSCLTVDTEVMTPADAGAAIVAHFRLGEGSNRE